MRVHPTKYNEERVGDEVLALLADPEWVQPDRPMLHDLISIARELQRHRATHPADAGKDGTDAR